MTRKTSSAKGKTRMQTALARGKLRRTVLLKLAQKYAGRDEPFPLLTDIAPFLDVGASEVSRAFCVLRDSGLITTTMKDRRTYIVSVAEKLPS